MKGIELIAGMVLGALIPLLAFYGVHDFSDPLIQVPLVSIVLVAILFLLLRKRWVYFSRGVLIGLPIGIVIMVWSFMVAASGALGGGFL